LRRTAIVSAALLMALLCGCGGRKEVTAGSINFTFSCSTDVSSPQGAVSYAVNRSGAAGTSLEVMSGTSKGLCWYWDGEGFSATYKGLAVKSGECVLPRSSPAAVLVSALSAAEKDGGLTRDGSGAFCGSTENGLDFTVTADAETYNIKTVSVPDCGIKADFYNYKTQSSA